MIVIARTSISRKNGEIAGIAAAPITVMFDVLLLFAGFVSGLDDVTDAVLDSGPAAEGRVSTSEMVAVAPLAIVPRVHVTVDVPLHEPCVGVAETNVVPEGMMSVTLTPPAGDGPALLMPIV